MSNQSKFAMIQPKIINATVGQNPNIKNNTGDAINSINPIFSPFNKSFVNKLYQNRPLKMSKGRAG